MVFFKISKIRDNLVDIRKIDSMYIVFFKFLSLICEVKL